VDEIADTDFDLARHDADESRAVTRGHAGTVGKAIAYILVALWTLLTFLPLVWMYLSSLKPLDEFLSDRWALPTSLELSNYINAWNGDSPGGGVAVPFSQYFFNSLVVTGISVFLTLLLGSLAAYALTRTRVPFRGLLAVLIVVGLALPTHALILPIWAVEDRIGLTSTYPGLILPYVGTALPFAILLLMAYFRSFSHDLEDAARVDGCNQLDVFGRIVIPMSKGPLAAVGILLANGFWNEFLFSLVLMSDNRMKTVPVGLYNFSAEYFTPYNLVLAGLGIATAPILILYVIFSRQVTSANVELVRG
jgi:ABC-type sugar transport system, permease component